MGATGNGGTDERIPIGGTHIHKGNHASLCRGHSPLWYERRTSTFDVEEENSTVEGRKQDANKEQRLSGLHPLSCADVTARFG